MTLITMTGKSFDVMCHEFRKMFLNEEPLMTGEWQSQDISDKPMLATRELCNVSLEIPITPGSMEFALLVGANLPWAEDHFAERVCGEPLNPPPSEAWWPYAQQGNKAAKEIRGNKFSHTYPERMWPKAANVPPWQHELDKQCENVPFVREGIRYDYGDLWDVVTQLSRGPLTRQAFLPIWFPEDTGAVKGQRVPCTLGYHFLIRENKLQITYYIRSCDFIRHFRDDVYMAGRLAQWMVAMLYDGDQEDQLEVGNLVMHIVSFHIFEGDVAMMKIRVKEAEQLRLNRLAGML